MGKFQGSAISKELGHHPRRRRPHLLCGHNPPTFQAAVIADGDLGGGRETN